MGSIFRFPGLVGNAIIEDWSDTNGNWQVTGEDVSILDMFVTRAATCHRYQV